MNGRSRRCGVVFFFSDKRCKQEDKTTKYFSLNMSLASKNLGIFFFFPFPVCCTFAGCTAGPRTCKVSRGRWILYSFWTSEFLLSKPSEVTNPSKTCVGFFSFLHPKSHEFTETHPLWQEEAERWPPKASLGPSRMLSLHFSSGNTDEVARLKAKKGRLGVVRIRDLH